MNQAQPLYIHGGTVFTPHKQIDKGAILIAGGMFKAVGSYEQIPCPENASKVDASGLTIAPGFIDLQCNGVCGHDFRTAPGSIWEAARELPRFGVTSFLPTIPTAPLESIAAAQSAITAANQGGVQGATPLGLHIEGPFLNPVKKGAHNAALLRTPDLSAVSDWSPQTGIRLVTLAPELPGAMVIVAHLRENGVVVSAGHSMASYEHAKAAIAAGVSYGTHLFNAMHPLDHREPGLVVGLLEDDRCTVGLIVDGIHLHPAMVKLIYTVKKKINLVTDAMAALGLGPGNYHYGDREVLVSAEDARLADGTLAGSVLSIDQALRNMIKFTGCPLIQALEMVTEIPASVLRVHDQRGRIAPGLVADLVLLSPQLQVESTYQAGKIVYQKGGRPL